MRLFSALAAVAALSLPLCAGEFNDKLSVGADAPAFDKLPGTDGKDYGLGDFKKDVVVVVITCNKCPMAIAYEDRIIDFAKKFGEKVDVVAINVNSAEADRPDKMKERAKEKGFNFPYVYDESQKIAMSLGARVTPEFFVLNKERKVVYMGAFDNNPRNAEKADKHYVEEAVTATLAGKPVAVTETQARGCGVGYNR